MTTSTQCINFVGFFVFPLCYTVCHHWQVLPQQNSSGSGWWGNATATLPCTGSSTSLHPLCWALPHQASCQQDVPGTDLSLKGLREAQESWNSHAAPKLQPKNTKKSQLHWLLMPLLRLKPGSFHVRLPFPHRFIQQVWKLGMERFSFPEHAVIKLQ